MRYSNAFGFDSAKVLLGTAYFGSSVPKETAFEILDKYYELGGNHIDTARLYSDGNSEKVIAEWIKSRKVQDIHISTKGGYPSGDDLSKPRLSEKELRKDLELSLTSLETDTIDFYWLHCDDRAISPEQIINLMNQLVKEGKIKKFGASNWNYSRIKEANDYAKKNNLAPFEAVQIRFSPAIVIGDNERKGFLEEMNKTAFDFYANESIPVAAYASQAKGFFSKIHSLGEEGLSGKAKERYLCKENLETLAHIEYIADSKGSSIASVVCGALSSLESPNTFPIIGASSVSQLEDSIKGGDLVLPDNELCNTFSMLR